MLETESSTAFDAPSLFGQLMRSLGQSPRTYEFEKDYRSWLAVLFPDALRADLASHHEQLWEWVWALSKGVRPHPFVGIWPRGGAKSSSAEKAVVAVGALEVRKYALYVSGTQELADKHLTDIARLLESDTIDQYYPDLGKREVSKYGISRGWTGNRLRTASGFMVDALGLNAAVRGLKAGDIRPDFVIIDDVDHIKDSRAQVEEKIITLTQSILPAGSNEMAVLAVQNIIHPDSVFARLGGVSEIPAEFLADRIVSGPIPAIEGLQTEKRNGRDVIIAGSPTWDGQGIEECQGQIDSSGITAFRRESQHEVEAPPGGMYDNVEFRHCTRDEVPALLTVVCAIDPAVTDTDLSDANGIQIDGKGMDGLIYRLFSWEQRSSAERTLSIALVKAVEYGAVQLIVETNQGGDTWEVIFNNLVKDFRDHGLVVDGVLHTMKPGKVIPRYVSEKASVAIGSKTERGAQMLADYERDQIIHVYGTHNVLEKALKRFPETKPLDLADSAYWSWQALAHPYPMGKRYAVSRPRQSIAGYVVR